MLEPDDEFDAALAVIALTLHYALAVLYSLALSRLVADTPRRYSAFIGIAFGIALYHVLHALFGLITAKAYWFFR